MRVLHVISGIGAERGGTVAALLGMARAQCRARLGVSVLATPSADEDTSAAENLRREGVDVQLVEPVRGPLGWHRDLGARVRSMVAEADIAHAHGLWEEIQHRTCRSARRRRVPYV